MGLSEAVEILKPLGHTQHVMGEALGSKFHASSTRFKYLLSGIKTKKKKLGSSEDKVLVTKMEIMARHKLHFPQC